jgi:competence protein ComEA
MKKMVRPALVCMAFLIASYPVQAQKPPEGKEKALLEEVCASCHDLAVVTTQHASKAGWKNIVDDMVARGASASEDQINQIVDYLAANYGQAASESKSKINVNTASATEIETALELTASESEAIVKYRADHGDFKTWDSLTKVPGVDAKKLEAKKDRVAFQ